MMSGIAPVRAVHALASRVADEDVDFLQHPPLPEVTVNRPFFLSVCRDAVVVCVAQPAFESCSSHARVMCAAGNVVHASLTLHAVRSFEGFHQLMQCLFITVLLQRIGYCIQHIFWQLGLELHKVLLHPERGHVCEQVHKKVEYNQAETINMIEPLRCIY